MAKVPGTYDPVGQIQLQYHDKYGVYTGAIMYRPILLYRQFVLIVMTELPEEQIRHCFPKQVKIGPVECIRDLVTVPLPGIGVRALPAPPRWIPYFTGATYFELDRGSPHWQGLQTSQAFAIYISDHFANLQLQLWAVDD